MGALCLLICGLCVHCVCLIRDCVCIVFLLRSTMHTRDSEVILGQGYCIRKADDSCMEGEEERQRNLEKSLDRSGRDRQFWDNK